MSAAGGQPVEPFQPREDSASSTGRLTQFREQQLLAAHRGGDVDAAAELLRAYQHRVYGVCYRMLRNTADAEDLTQDSLVRVLEGLESFDGRSQLSTWIIRVTMNCCLSHLRKAKLRRHASLDDSGISEDLPWRQIVAVTGELSPQEHVEKQETQGVLLRALEAIDPRMRAVIVLRDLQGLDYQQIATVLGVPVGTVKSRLFRARAALRIAAEEELNQSETTQET